MTFSSRSAIYLSATLLTFVNVAHASSPTPTPAATPTATATGTILVSNLVVASGRAYQWFDLASGQNMYIDRTYRFGSPIPASINGQFTLRTANDDKFSSANATHVSFTVNQASTVYVLYTTVSTTLETTWLTDANGWSLEDYTVPTTLPGAEAARKVRKKTFAAGATVTLNGNGSTNSISSMYNVVVAPDPCVTADCYVYPMPLYGQHNAAFPFNGSYYCAPTTTAMMIQSQLDKAGVTVRSGSWTYDNFVGTPYETKVLAEASAMHTDDHNRTDAYNVWLGFNNPLLDVVNSDGTASVYEEDSHYPTQRTLDGYKEKLRSGYAVGLLIDFEREKRVYDGFPSCNLVRYEYHKSGGHFVAVRGFDGNFFFINNPSNPSRDKRSFGVMPHVKNGLPVQVYLENNWLVPDAMNVNYIGPINSNNVPTTCGANNISCQCDLSLGITTTPVYAATTFDTLYLAH